jgi:chromate reductase
MSRDQGILIFAGSTREGSLNRALARNAAIAATELRLDATLLDLREYPLPLYEHDVERTTGMPRNAMSLRAQLKRHATWLIVSPDHHGSTSTLLRNVIDWAACRVVGEQPGVCFRQKTIGLLSTLNDAHHGAPGVAHLRQILTHLGASVGSGEFLIPGHPPAFDSEGNLLDGSRRAALREFVHVTHASTRPLPSSATASLADSFKNLATRWSFASPG